MTTYFEIFVIGVFGLIKPLPDTLLSSILKNRGKLCLIPRRGAVDKAVAA
jgi:hypothetical protein